MERLLLEDGWLLDPEAEAPRRGSLLVADGRIAAQLRPAEAAPVEARRISLGDASIAPGFIDLHHHGSLIFARPGEILDALARDASCVRYGTTAFLVTSVAWPASPLLDWVKALAAALSEPPPNAGAHAIGLHLEGPWIDAGAAGAQPREGIRPCELEEARALLDTAEGAIRMVTLAPEVKGGGALVDLLVERRVIASLGHSRATASEVDDAVRRGARHVTHLFNAMRGLHHREPGLVGAALMDDRLTCDLICDGVHVAPRIVALTARAARERLVLITDRIDPQGAAEAGPVPSFGSGGLRDDGTVLRLEDGRLAGSCLTLDRAIRNASAFANLSILEAVAACTLRPARLLGIEAERGTLRPGARADFAVLDAAGRVRETWIGGRRVYAAPDAGR